MYDVIASLPVLSLIQEPAIPQLSSLRARPAIPIRILPMYSYVYFMTNSNNTVLYVGVTSNLEKRVWEHKQSIVKSSFTYKYNCHKLVYYEAFGDIRYAIAREKQIKNWKREWKNELITNKNPDWVDLSDSEWDCGSSPQ